eukprot:gb/GEZJ01007410.1/.p1 GENE.gb/GEZJ01007410.1/~~gb/GEZJ01007410.1/.p1  ORF type:complete len:131 (-),score=1.93 gb/GEZJ01007410.1/:188-580(-)
MYNSSLRAFIFCTRYVTQPLPHKLVDYETQPSSPPPPTFCHCLVAGNVCRSSCPWCGTCPPFLRLPPLPTSVILHLLDVLQIQRANIRIYLIPFAHAAFLQPLVQNDIKRTARELREAQRSSPLTSLSFI